MLACGLVGSTALLRCSKDAMVWRLSLRLQRASPFPFCLRTRIICMARSLNPSFLREAIRLSMEKMQADAGGPFGAVIVRDGQIIGRGWNQVTSTMDPTAHAEVVAIRAACIHQQSFSLAGCEIYSSCEPCPLCMAAIFWSRLDAIYYAATCDDAASAGFDDRNFYEEIRKPAKERSIPMQQGLRDEALLPLHAWMNKIDRIRY